MKKNKNLSQDGRHEMVVLKKDATHVAISGPYTKRELRRLLLSSISLLQSDEKASTELDSTITKKTGLSQVDLDKLKEGKVDEISEEADRALKDLDVTKDTIRSAIKKKGDDAEERGDKKREDKKRGDQKRGDQKRGDQKSEKEDLEKRTQKSFKKLLQERGLSESLVKSLMENGLTDEYVRLLKALGFTDMDIEQLRMSWQDEIYDSVSLTETEKSSASPTSSSDDDDLSPESLYLKHFLSKVLARALRDIASKKPYDPIEYLGHWLLHLKICEERDKRRKEYEMELMIERERYRMINIEDQEILEIESGGQECDEGWIAEMDE